MCLLALMFIPPDPPHATKINTKKIGPSKVNLPYVRNTAFHQYGDISKTALLEGMLG